MEITFGSAVSEGKYRVTMAVKASPDERVVMARHAKPDLYDLLHRFDAPRIGRIEDINVHTAAFDTVAAADLFINQLQAGLNELADTAQHSMIFATRKPKTKTYFLGVLGVGIDPEDLDPENWEG